MSSSQRPADLLSANVALIERIVRALCRRNGLPADEVDDCASWIKLKLIENDYSRLRKFRGESSFTTYLTVVIAMLVRDHRVQRCGRWRPSAAAERLGEVAIRLEVLIYRQGHTLDEAAQILRLSGTAKLSDRELSAMFAALPARLPLRPRVVPAPALSTLEASDRSDDALATEIAEAERQKAEQALRRALSQLPHEDRLILEMRFWENSTVADIARALQLDPKALYRRIDKLLVSLRAALLAADVTAEHTSALFEEAAR